jgi:hypothetical protein
MWLPILPGICTRHVLLPLYFNLINYDHPHFVRALYIESIIQKYRLDLGTRLCWPVILQAKHAFLNILESVTFESIYIYSSVFG